jgi:hypothetical protein
MKRSVKALVGATLVVSTLGLGACADGATYTSFGVGVSSYDDGYYGPRDYGYGGYGYSGRDRDWDGIPNRFDRDRDGDGIPNRFDSRPNNPRWR